MHRISVTNAIESYTLNIVLNERTPPTSDSEKALLAMINQSISNTCQNYGDTRYAVFTLIVESTSEQQPV